MTKQKTDCQGGIALRLKRLQKEPKPSLTVGLLLGRECQLPINVARAQSQSSAAMDRRSDEKDRARRARVISARPSPRRKECPLELHAESCPQCSLSAPALFSTRLRRRQHPARQFCGRVCRDQQRPD